MWRKIILLIFVSCFFKWNNLFSTVDNKTRNKINTECEYKASHSFGIQAMRSKKSLDLLYRRFGFKVYPVKIAITRKLLALVYTNGKIVFYYPKKGLSEYNFTGNNRTIINKILGINSIRFYFKVKYPTNKVKFFAFGKKGGYYKEKYYNLSFPITSKGKYRYEIDAIYRTRNKTTTNCFNEGSFILKFVNGTNYITNISERYSSIGKAKSSHFIISFLIGRKKDETTMRDFLVFAESIYEYISDTIDQKTHKIIVINHPLYRKFGIFTPLSANTEFNYYAEYRNNNIYLPTSKINDINIPILAHEITHAIFYDYHKRYALFFHEGLSRMFELLFSFPYLELKENEYDFKSKLLNYIISLSDELAAARIFNMKYKKWVPLQNILRDSVYLSASTLLSSELDILNLYLLDKYGLSNVVKFYITRNANLAFGKSLVELNREIYQLIRPKMQDIIEKMYSNDVKIVGNFESNANIRKGYLLRRFRLFVKANRRLINTFVGGLVGLLLIIIFHKLINMKKKKLC